MKQMYTTIDYTEIPEGVNFTAQWFYNGELWADTFKIIDGLLYMFDVPSDDFLTYEGNVFEPNVVWFTYFA